MMMDPFVPNDSAIVVYQYCAAPFTPRGYKPLRGRVTRVRRGSRMQGTRTKGHHHDANHKSHVNNIVKGGLEFVVDFTPPMPSAPRLRGRNQRKGHQRRSAIQVAEPKHFGARPDWPHAKRVKSHHHAMPCRTVPCSYAMQLERKEDGTLQSKVRENKECA